MLYRGFELGIYRNLGLVLLCENQVPEQPKYYCDALLCPSIVFILLSWINLS